MRGGQTEFLIANPASGPGSGDTTYVTQINQTRAAGITVMGYVATTYTAKPIGSVYNEIDTWFALYNVNGIFFDEVSSSCATTAYYQQICDYVRSKTTSAYTALNPGVGVPSCFDGIATAICTYEGTASGYAAAPQQAWEATATSKIWHLMYDDGCNNVAAIVNVAVSKNADLVYITDDGLSSQYGPWDLAPTCWDAFVAAVAAAPTGNPGGPGGPGGPVSTSSQITFTRITTPTPVVGATVKWKFRAYANINDPVAIGPATLAGRFQSPVPANVVNRSWVRKEYTGAIFGPAPDFAPPPASGSGAIDFTTQLFHPFSVEYEITDVLASSIANGTVITGTGVVSAGPGGNYPSGYTWNAQDTVTVGQTGGPVPDPPLPTTPRDWANRPACGAGSEDFYNDDAVPIPPNGGLVNDYFRTGQAEINGHHKYQFQVNAGIIKFGNCVMCIEMPERFITLQKVRARYIGYYKTSGDVSSSGTQSIFEGPWSNMYPNCTPRTVPFGSECNGGPGCFAMPPLPEDALGHGPVMIEVECDASVSEGGFFALRLYQRAAVPAFRGPNNGVAAVCPVSLIVVTMIPTDTNVIVGEPSQYTVTIKNAGTAPANGLVVVAPSPSGVEYKTRTVQVTGTVTGQTVGDGTFTDTLNMAVGSVITYNIPTIFVTPGNYVSTVTVGGVAHNSAAVNADLRRDWQGRPICGAGSALYQGVAGAAPQTVTITVPQTVPNVAGGGTIIVDVRPEAYNGARLRTTGGNAQFSSLRMSYYDAYNTPKTHDFGFSSSVSPGGTALPDAPADAIAIRSLSYTYTNDANTGVYLDVATSPTYNGPNGGVDKPCVDANRTSDIVATMTALDTSVQPGQVAHYKWLIVNNGPAAAVLSLSNALSSFIASKQWSTDASASAQFSGGTTGTGAIAGSINLPAGGHVEFYISDTVAASVPSTVAAVECLGASALPEGWYDPSPQNAQNQLASTPIAFAGSIIASLNVSPTVTYPGGTVSFTATIVNTHSTASGPDNVAVSFPRPDSLEAWSWTRTGTGTGPATGTGATISDIVTVLPGETATFVATGTVKTVAYGPQVIGVLTTTPASTGTASQSTARATVTTSGGPGGPGTSAKDFFLTGIAHEGFYEYLATCTGSVAVTVDIYMEAVSAAPGNDWTITNPIAITVAGAPIALLGLPPTIRTSGIGTRGSSLSRTYIVQLMEGQTMQVSARTRLVGTVQTSLANKVVAGPMILTVNP